MINLTLDKKDPTDKMLFFEAMRIANLKGEQRVIDFNASYAFSRAILTNMLLVGVILIYSNYDNIWYYAVSILLFIIALLRYRQRDGFYIREVLNVCQNVLEERK